MQNLKELFDGLAIPGGSSRRVDCPSCGGSNTLSISNSNGTYLYNCYKASCTLHGAVGGQVTLKDLELSLIEKSRSQAIFSVPPYFTQGIRPGTYNDNRENREVFLVKTYDGTIVDAVGRSRVPGVKPKWKRYSDSRHPLILGPYEGIGVVVEDAYSAAAVANTGQYSGIAILGTSIHVGFMDWAKRFKGLIIALDYDATNKAIDYYSTLSWFLPTAFVKLSRDLKVYSKEEIIKILEPAKESLCQNLDL